MPDSIHPPAVSAKQGSTGPHVLRAEVFQPYVRNLAGLFHDTVARGSAQNQTQLVAALDGQPGRELRKLYSAASLRYTGTFFTGSRLASRLVDSAKHTISAARQVIDPACGAGDLLVACARHFPVRSNVIDTLKEWGNRLVGFDINSAFVDAARYRLALLALERGGVAAETFPKANLPLDRLFPNIRTGSGLQEWRLQNHLSVVVVNPPFAYGKAAKDCTWASGRVSQAALFIDKCVQSVAHGTRILAILPDVLRTGSRYERWRDMVAEKTRVRSVKIAGQFDTLTDISVFLLELEVGQPERTRQISWARPVRTGNAKRTVEDFFDIRVGPVVPFRLDGSGSWFPYAHSDELPPWQIVRSLRQSVRFTGTTYKPPFVVIRRTSKAAYHVRCIGTIVTGKKATAVENHLLLAIPRDKRVSTCKRFLKVLKRTSSSKWMNKRIRCRHLTVSSVRDLPWRG
jgi:hypothetical protein